MAEVEVDGLTGEMSVLRVDLQYDSGRSLNPAVDVGQIEGAYVCGLGMMTTESVEFEPGTGALLSGSTWQYKIPSAACVPRDLRIYLLDEAKFGPHNAMPCNVFWPCHEGHCGRSAAAMTGRCFVGP